MDTDTKIAADKLFRRINAVLIISLVLASMYGLFWLDRWDMATFFMVLATFIRITQTRFERYDSH